MVNFVMKITLIMTLQLSIFQILFQKMVKL